LDIIHWDLHRSYWRCYYENTSAIIVRSPRLIPLPNLLLPFGLTDVLRQFVIDSSDRDRLQISRSELLTLLSEDELLSVPVLVFANKQDIQGAMKPEEISDALGLAGVETNRPWSVRGSSALKGDGLEEGMDWYVLSRPLERLILIAGLGWSMQSNHRVRNAFTQCTFWNSA